MKRRQRKLFAEKIVDLPMNNFSGVLTRLIETNQVDLAVEVRNQLKKKIESRRISLDEKNYNYVPKYEQIVKEIDSIYEQCKSLIEDTADLLDEFWDIYETETENE